MYTYSFECMKCDKDFTAEWNFGDDVTCTHCNIRFETDYDTNEDDDINGPWLVQKKDD